jgi:3-methyladenine DNA glycosylase AlkD
MTKFNEKKLIDEINFWIEYIEYWSKNSKESVPQTALDALDHAILMLKHYNINQEIINNQQNRLLH